MTAMLNKQRLVKYIYPTIIYSIAHLFEASLLNRINPSPQMTQPADPLAAYHFHHNSNIPQPFLMLKEHTRPPVILTHHHCRLSLILLSSQPSFLRSRQSYLPSPHPLFPPLLSSSVSLPTTLHSSALP